MAANSPLGLGACPGKHSSGGKPALLGISKPEDVYLRTPLIHRARAVVQSAERKIETKMWLKGLLGRRHKNVAAVALAHQNVRTVWALLVHGHDDRPDDASSVSIAA